ncbi:putative disease resistance protein At1g59780 [Dioscorea cayenensis subsp. rotundata]|uniref:Disease resistance protein At1g59780 n=1 Tax=Dioscorea cayennensis subsp. rotundata TaxID=55577 RepID=A0AB40D2V6_DIOCR|nr:putative disease resistance protein At1g59780 [Dioscorea cayenensis subsp. rotundata]
MEDESDEEMKKEMGSVWDCLMKFQDLDCINMLGDEVPMMLREFMGRVGDTHRKLQGKLAKAHRDQMMKKMARVRDILTELQERLEMAYRKLQYADDKMMIVPYDTTNTWFDNLRGVSNDLKNISDELFKYMDTMEIMFSKVHWYSPFIYLYQQDLCFPWQINSQIRTLGTIESRLEEILKQELNLGLTLFDLDTTIGHDTLVGGIEKDVENLVEMLTVTHSSQGIYVYGIVGERGIGKTTLAKLIFNHKKIKDKFHSLPPIWFLA